MSPRTRRLVERLGMIGTAARGAVFALAGVLVIEAAVTYLPASQGRWHRQGAAHAAELVSAPPNAMISSEGTGMHAASATMSTNTATYPQVTMRCCTDQQPVGTGLPPMHTGSSRACLS